MPKIQLENGTILEFDKEPTVEDIEFAAGQINARQEPTFTRANIEEIAPDAREKLSLGRKAQLSFADIENKVKLLKEDFKFVVPQQDGTILVGDNPRQLQPYNSQNIMSDFLGTVADNANMIPSIAGQIALTAGTGGYATVPMLMARGALGAGLGELVAKAGAKVGGINKENAEEVATDAVISGAFGAGGEAVGAGLKGAANVVFPKVGKWFDDVINNSSNKEATADTFANVMHMATGIAPADFKEGAEYGFKNLFNKSNLNPKEALNIAQQTKQAVDAFQDVAQSEIAKADATLLNKVSSKYKVDSAPTANFVLEEMQKAGMVDSFGVINKESLVSSKNTQIFVRLLEEMGAKKVPIKTFTNELDSAGNVIRKKPITQYKIELPEEGIPLNKAMQVNKAAQSRFNDVDDRFKYIMQVATQGDENIAGLGLANAIKGVAKEAGDINFLKTYQKYADFKSTISALKQSGLDLDNMTNAESFLSTIRTKPYNTQNLLNSLSNQTGSDFYQRARAFDLAQRFAETNSNFFRLGAVAGLAGASIGGGDITSRLARGAIIFGLSSPQTMRAALIQTEKLGKVASKVSSNIRKSTVNSATGAASKALLSKILESRASEQIDSKK